MMLSKNARGHEEEKKVQATGCGWRKKQHGQQRSGKTKMLKNCR